MRSTRSRQLKVRTQAAHQRVHMHSLVPLSNELNAKTAAHDVLEAKRG